MIHSFSDKPTESCFLHRPVRSGWQHIQRIAERKLLALNAAVELKDLASPPGNHLEALKGDRTGQHSIRINEKWRLCFTWKADGAHDVEITDYH